MKKIISILLLATFCIFTQLHAQNRADELMKQAQENLTKKEYIKARYLFLQAYNAFATQDKYAQAVECGVNASALYHRENYYKEAFELLRDPSSQKHRQYFKALSLQCHATGRKFITENAVTGCTG